MPLNTSDFLLIAASEGGANIFIYFDNSNLAGKLIVIALFIFSLLAWTVMIGKYLELSRLRLSNHALEQSLASSESTLNIEAKGIGGPYATLLNSAQEAIKRFADRQGESKQVRMGHVENALQRAVARQCIRYEHRMVVLGSIVSGSPFLGLLGTVWGVMDAFGSMSAQSTATLQHLAPGVSGALLTTVAGLLVAIPAVFGYNFLLTKAKIMVTELENFASSLADRIELEMD